MAPWLEKSGLAFLLFPRILFDMFSLKKYVDTQVTERVRREKEGEKMTDIFKRLLDHRDPKTGESMEFQELSDEAIVLIIAGTWK